MLCYFVRNATLIDRTQLRNSNSLFLRITCHAAAYYYLILSGSVHVGVLPDCEHNAKHALRATQAYRGTWDAILTSVRRLIV